LETSLDNATWYHIVHWQLAAGAAAVNAIVTVNRGGVTTITTPGTEALTVNTTLQMLGDFIRLREVAGAGTSAGTSQRFMYSCVGF